MNQFEQYALYGVTIVILAGTLVVFVMQYLRMNRRDKDE